MPNCESLISKDIDRDCDNPSVTGLEANAVIINRSDIDFSSVTFANGKRNIIENLGLKNGKKGYAMYVPGATPYTGTTKTLNVGTYINTFNNEFHAVILNGGPDVCENIIDGLANGSFLVVFENKFKAGENKEGAFEIMGFYQGLTATELSNDKYGEDTEGGWAVTLTENRSPKSGLYLFKTSYEATETLFNSLKTAAGGSL